MMSGGNVEGVWGQIWVLQGQLNKMVGVDTIYLGETHTDFYTEKTMWLRRYLDECVNEAVECKENFYHKWWCKEVKDGGAEMYSPVDAAKVKLELIDCLHFCISALHLSYPSGNGLEFDAIPMFIPQTWKDMYMGLNKLIQFCLLNLPDHVFYELRALMCYMKLEEPEILRIYEMKWRANVARQQNGYSVGGKTEQDNISIEKQIK
jgi:dimeric dUTPase (all-alpha-NTP-PPase superfamily)